MGIDNQEISLELYQSFDERALRPEWSKLNLPSPMQSYTWLRNWWEAYRDRNTTLQVLAMRDQQGQLLGIAPLYVLHRSFLDELRFLGDDRVCSDYSSVLYTPAGSQRVDAIGNAFCRWCVQQMNQFNVQLAFDAICDRDPISQWLTNETMLGQSMHMRVVESAGTFVVALPSTLDEYLMQLTKNHRKRCRSMIRKYFDTGRADVRVVDSCPSPDQLREDLNLFAVMHSERNHTVGRKGAFDDHRFVKFHSAVLPKLLDEQRAELRFLSIDGQAVACEYLLRSATSLYAYQSGLTRSGMQYSAGNLSVLDMIRSAIERQFSTFDFLRGGESYKFHWGVTHVSAHDYYQRSRNPQAVIMAGAQRSLHGVKKLIGSV